MKKVLYLSLASTAIFGLASCSNDDMPFDGKAGVETFRLKLPTELASREYNDGLTATNLKIAVYNANSGELVISNFDEGVNTDLIGGECVFVNREAQVDLTLGKNEDYNIVFWAESYSENSPYQFNATDKTMTIHYENAMANDENRDAFYTYEHIKATGIDHNIDLYRPFAQINVGTDDYATAQKTGLTVTKTGLVFSELANTFSLESGECSGSVQNVVFANNDIPDGETFPAGTGMKYLAMAYVLVGSPSAAKATMDVSMYVNNNEYDANKPEDFFSQYPSIPAQQNYQTNIYGSLLTNKEHFNVDIRPAFEDEFNENQNGVPEITPVEKEIDGVMTTVYPVASPENLEWLLQQLNNGQVANNSYIELTSNVNMSGKTAIPINNFNGTFDGQNHRITNLSLSSTGTNMGLFMSVNKNATVKNLTIANSTVSGNTATGAIAGNVSGVVDNCHNVNTTVTGTESVGGISGIIRTGGVISNCTNSGTISSTAAPASASNSNKNVTGIGGIVGTVGIRSTNGDAITIENCVNDGMVSAVESCFVGGIIGACPNYAPTNVNNCTNNANIGSGKELCSGGIMGARAAVSGDTNITGCTNNGAITAKKYAGGIYGGENTVSQFSNISKCTNTGKVTGGIFAGGIAACIGEGLVSECINTAAVSSPGETVIVSGKNKGVFGAAGGVVGYFTRGYITACQGGSNTISALTAAGRVVGAVTNGSISTNYMCYLNLISEGNDYTNIGTIGTMGWEPDSVDAKLTVLSGELVGNPLKARLKSARIIISEGASWLGKTDPVGTWNYVSGAWTKI